MTYWWMLLAIAFLIIAAWTSTSDGLRSRINRTAVRALMVIGLLIISAFLLLVALASADRFMSADQWYERSPMREVVLFVLMSLGMGARMLSLAIEERSTKRSKLKQGEPAPSIRIDGWDVLYPFLSSSICFGALVESVSESQLSLPVALLAFQNGFFWQTVLGGIQARS